jgi:hypothetical protein
MGMLDSRADPAQRLQAPELTCPSRAALALWLTAAALTPKNVS